MIQVCLFAHIEIEDEKKSSNVYTVTCIHGKTLAINTARKILGLSMIWPEEMREIERRKKKEHPVLGGL